MSKHDDDDLVFLGCLEAVGVDNWQGYDIARDMLLEQLSECEKEPEAYVKELMLLDCLMACGVDNWEWYEEAQKMFRECLR